MFNLVNLNPLRRYHAISFVEEIVQFHGINRYCGAELPQLSPLASCLASRKPLLTSSDSRWYTRFFALFNFFTSE
eukprot:3915759-Pyramimonas_sp.AAC.1